MTDPLTFHAAWGEAADLPSYYKPDWLRAQPLHEGERHTMADWLDVVKTADGPLHVSELIRGIRRPGCERPTDSVEHVIPRVAQLPGKIEALEIETTLFLDPFDAFMADLDDRTPMDGDHQVPTRSGDVALRELMRSAYEAGRVDMHLHDKGVAVERTEIHITSPVDADPDRLISHFTRKAKATADRRINPYDPGSDGV